MSAPAMRTDDAVVILDRDDECVRCGAALKAGRPVRWFEFRVRDFSPVLRGDDPIPETESQGAFPMGLDCATRVLGHGWDGTWTNRGVRARR